MCKNKNNNNNKDKDKDKDNQQQTNVKTSRKKNKVLPVKEKEVFRGETVTILTHYKIIALVMKEQNNLGL